MKNITPIFPGGILESFGRMFKNDLKLYVYPLLEAKTGALITAANLRVAPNLRHLHAYLIENRFIEALRDYDETGRCPSSPATCLQKIRVRRSVLGRAWSPPKWPEMPGTKSVRLQRRVLIGSATVPVAASGVPPGALRHLT